MPFALLLAMQAAGMITDYFGSKSQQDFMNMGAKVQQAGIEADIQQTRLETEDASLNAMIQLRQNIGSQMAIFAARGTSTGQGNSFSFINQSVGTFNKDERMRRMNELSRENSLKAGGAISRLNQFGENSKLWQGFASRTVNRFGTSASAYGWGGSSGSGAFSGSSAGGSYGLTPRS